MELVTRKAGLAPACRMKQRLRLSFVLDVYGIPGEEVVVHRPAGARPALRITAMLANGAREVGS